jgi:hypothetical protein
MADIPPPLPPPPNLLAYAADVHPYFHFYAAFTRRMSQNVQPNNDHSKTGRNEGLNIFIFS